MPMREAKRLVIRKYILRNRGLLSWLFLVLFFFVESLNAQNFDSLSAAYQTKNPQEKVYIHFDNSLYLPGQTVWYKAYLTNGNEPSEISKNLYIDIFDIEGRLLNRNLSPILGSVASGNFMVPEKYTGTKLHVLAYTQWMLNFDSAYLFRQELLIGQTNQIKSVLALPSEATLQFFPEGGDLIENIPSSIAFKCKNSEGFPINVKGVIYNKLQQTVAEFISEHDGMGRFVFTPLPGVSYTAEWKDPLGVMRYTQLPAAKKTGVVLSINNENGTRSFTIQRSENIEERYKRITILVSWNQQELFQAKANLTDKIKLASRLPISDFPSGVIQVTLLDNEMQPIVERVTFVLNDEYSFFTEVHTDTINLKKRGKNVYQIEVTDSIPTSLSLAITDGGGVNDSSNHIISQLLLSSEIKGRIHNPAYYFSDKNDSASRYLDLVMLTNGWRRFVWENVLQGKMPKVNYSRDSGYLSISGKINGLSENKIKKAELVNLILMGKDSSRQFVFTPLLADGSFREDNLILFDTTKVFYKLNKSYIPEKSKVVINNTFLPFNPSKRIPTLANYLSDSSGMARIQEIAKEKKRLEFLIQQTTLKEVIVVAKVKTRIQELEETYTTGLFQSGNARQYNIMDDPFNLSYNNIFTFIESKAPGLVVRNPYSFNPTISWRNSAVSVYLDEMLIDVSFLTSMQISSIGYIKLFYPPFFGAFAGGGGGALAIYTKKGNDIRTLKGLDYVMLPGYSPIKEFYSPNYAEKNLRSQEIDIRPTLYWNPNVLTDGENKKVSFSFYNNDISHSFQLVLQGMAQDGRLIHIRKFIK